MAQGTTPQSISFLPVPDRPVNSAPFQVVALSSAYLPVTLSVAGPATLNGRVLTLTGPGVVTVSAAQAGNTQYAPTAAQLSFQSQPVVPQISWSPPSPLTYGMPVNASLLDATATAAPVIDAAADAATIDPRTSVSSLGNNVPVYGPASSAFRYEGTVLSESTDPNADGGWSGNNLPAPYGLTYRVGFTCDCQEFEISFQTRYSLYRLWVDGNWTTTDAIRDATGFPGHTFVLVHFPDRRLRQIKFTIDSNAPFFGVSTPPGEATSAPQVPLGPPVMIFGDSWTGPTILPPAIGPAQPGLLSGGFPEMLGEYFNWNYWTDGIGGSGFTQPGMDELGRTWVQRLMTDVCGNSSSLDRVLIVGSVNDGGSSEAVIQQAIETSLGELDSCMPAAPIYLTGPQMPASNIEAADAAASAAYPANLTTLDIAQQNLFYGSSTDSSTGNEYLYFNGHPTPLGHDFFAEALVVDLLARLPSLAPVPYTLMAPVNTPGSFTYSVAPGILLPAGSTAISASFRPSDQTNFASVTATQRVQINKAHSSTMLSGFVQQGKVVLTASVAPQIAGTPTGTVSLSATVPSLETFPIGTVQLVGGKATIAVKLGSLPAGPIVISAAYPGDTNFLSSAATPQTVFNTPPAAPARPVRRPNPLPPVRHATAQPAKAAPPQNRPLPPSVMRPHLTAKQARVTSLQKATMPGPTR